MVRKAVLRRPFGELDRFDIPFLGMYDFFSPFSNTAVAVKCVTVEDLKKNRKGHRRILNEMEIHARLSTSNHPNIVKLYV